MIIALLSVGVVAAGSAYLGFHYGNRAVLEAKAEAEAALLHVSRLRSAISSHIRALEVIHAINPENRDSYWQSAALADIRAGINYLRAKL